MNRNLCALLLILLFSLCCHQCLVFAKNLENSRYKRTINNNHNNNNNSNDNINNNCNDVKLIFQSWNISLPSHDNNAKGDVCGGDCCGPEAESILRKQGQKDFASLLRHNSRSLQGLLSFTRASLQNHVSELSRQSENKTLLLFSQIYKGKAILSQEPITALYSDIRNYITVNSTIGQSVSMSRSSISDVATTIPPNNDGGGGGGARTNIDVATSVVEFFTEFFPLVYHHILLDNKDNKDFTLDYKICLKKTMATIQPFGNIPNHVGQSLAKSLEATRLLLQAFQIGSEVLNTTDQLLIEENGKNNIECHRALLKMTYCPRCMGLTKKAKPCSGYCLNVLRGCLTKYVAELDSPWNGYVEGIESLVNAMKKNNIDSGVNVDVAIKSIDTKISEAIMQAMEKGQEIDTKVKRNCGPAAFTDQPTIVINSTNATSTLSTIKPRLANSRVFASMPETHLAHFLASIAKTRGFYSNLADTLCQDDSFAEQKDVRCWNGERIAEYTKTVVDVGLDMQKYNPEVIPTPSLQSMDPRIADLVDKLRHVHHMAMSSIGPSPGVEVDYMQRDGVDGSGSGYGPDFDDGDEDSVRGSGSGHGATTDGEPEGKQKVDVNIDIRPSPPHGYNPTQSTAGCISLESSRLLLTSLVLVVVVFVKFY